MVAFACFTKNTPLIYMDHNFSTHYKHDVITVYRAFWRKTYDPCVAYQDLDVDEELAA